MFGNTWQEFLQGAELEGIYAKANGSLQKSLHAQAKGKGKGKSKTAQFQNGSQVFGIDPEDY